MDKCLARTVAEAREIREAVQSSDVKILLSYPYRFVPSFRTLADRLREGVYADPVSYTHHSIRQFPDVLVLVDSVTGIGGAPFHTDAWDVDLVLTGRQSVDENSGAVFAGVACKLGWPLVTNVVKIVDIADGKLTVERTVDGQQETLSVKLPAVMSVTPSSLLIVKSALAITSLMSSAVLFA